VRVTPRFKMWCHLGSLAVMAVVLGWHGEWASIGVLWFGAALGFNAGAECWEAWGRG
jgi:hypothetical protein